MILNVFLVLIVICLSDASKTNKISLNCDVRPFNDLNLLNYFLKEQIKQNPVSSDDLTRKFYEFRDTVDLNALEADCDKKSKAKFALIKVKGKNEKYEITGSASKRSNKKRKEISQRMSLELVNALLLGKILGLNLGMLSSVIFKNAFKPNIQGNSTPAPGAGNPGGGTEGGSEDNSGGGNSGGDNSGGDNSGGDNSGGDNSGGDNSEGDNSGGDNSEGDAGDDAGGDTERFRKNYDIHTDENVPRNLDGHEEDCDDHESINETPVESYNDQMDWSQRSDYSRKRHKRDLFGRRHSPQIAQHLISTVEDNEDLWSNSGTSLYIPTLNHRYAPDLIDSRTAVRDHLQSTNSKKENLYPSYSLTNENTPFITPSSFAFSQIPVLYKPNQRVSTFHSKNKSKFDLQTNDDANGRTSGSANRRQTSVYAHSVPNFNYDQTDLADSDGMNNRREEIDLEYKEKVGKEPQYFDDEFEDEFNQNFNKHFDKEFTTDEFKKKFDENFDKEFNPRWPKNKKRNRSPKKKVDLSQLEREDDVRKDVKDSEEKKIVRITRQITVYNKNLFEDKFDVTGVYDNGNLLDGEDLLNMGERANLEDRKENVKNDENVKKGDLPRLKKKKRVRKRIKGKRKVPASKERTKNKKRVQSTGKRRKGKRKRTKSKNLNLISQNDSSIYIKDNVNLLPFI